MENFKASHYQQEVFDFVKYGYGNAVVSARAGSGKTTLIVKCLDFIKPDKKVLFLAFNNAIAKELECRINRPKTDIKTLHSLGFSILKYNYKDLDLQIDENKYKKRLNSWLDIDSKNIPEKKVKKYRNNILKLTDLGRYYLVKNIGSLEEVATKHNIVLVEDELEMVLNMLSWARNSIQETHTIDFGDMLYLPNILPIRTFKYDFIIVDEAQDLSNSQLQLFLKCFKQGGRFIAVGDEKQSIYGFSGADTQSFNKIKQLPNTTELPLSICYRCPGKVIELAQKIVPEIEKREGAPDGYVDYKADISDVKDGDMVICRNTLPLVKLYLQMITNGTKAYIKGREIGENMISVVENTIYENLNIKLDNTGVFVELYVNLIDYIEQTKNLMGITEVDVYETQEFNNMLDMIECLEVASIGLDTKEELLERLKTIFKDNSAEGICLSTIHKAKGLEADNVYILNRNLMPSKYVKQDWEIEQEENLIYVAYTRPKVKLGFIYSNDLNGAEIKTENKILDIRISLNNIQ